MKDFIAKESHKLLTLVRADYCLSGQPLKHLVAEWLFVQTLLVRGWVT